MKTILFVDDELAVLSGLRRALSPMLAEWDMLFVDSARSALDIVSRAHIDLIVTDIDMPGMDGMQLVKVVCEAEGGFVPVIVLTGKSDVDLKRRALDYGAQDLLQKPVSADDLVARIRSVLSLKQHLDRLAQRNNELEAMVIERTAELASSRLEVVIRLAKAAELHDIDTGNHVLRVGLYSKVIAETLGLSAKLCDELLLASILHDVGKIGVPDTILRKPAPLTTNERALMQSHCHKGYRILTEQDSYLLSILAPKFRSDPYGASLLSQAAEIARSHHEKWDGTGYPERLSERDIPFYARIVAVADVYDALRCNRPYKESLSEDMSLEIMAASRGTHFDPEVYDAFVACKPRIQKIDSMIGSVEVEPGLTNVA